MNGEERQDQKQNHINLSDTLLKIIDHSDKESQRLYRIYRILVGSITIIVIIGIGIGCYFTYKSQKDMRDEHRDQVKDMRNDLGDQTKDMKEKMDNDFTVLQNHLKSTLEMTVTDMGNRVNKRIDDEFKEEKIQTLIKQKAEEYTEKNVHNYIGEKVDNTIEPIVNTLRQQNETLTKQVDDWNNRSKLMKLSDKAIDSGDAQSFRDLLKYNGTDLELAASAEAARVKIAYVSARRLISSDDLTVTESDGSKKTNNDIKTSMLINILKTDKSWESRVKAAQFLANRSQDGVPDALLESCKKDNHLDVVRASLESFRRITGHSYDVLECDNYEKWWSENKSEIAKKLKPIDSK